MAAKEGLLLNGEEFVNDYDAPKHMPTNDKRWVEQLFSFSSKDYGFKIATYFIKLVSRKALKILLMRCSHIFIRQLFILKTRKISLSLPKYKSIQKYSVCDRLCSPNLWSSFCKVSFSTLARTETRDFHEKIYRNFEEACILGQSTARAYKAKTFNPRKRSYFW